MYRHVIGCSAIHSRPPIARRRRDRCASGNIQFPRSQRATRRRGIRMRPARALFLPRGTQQVRSLWLAELARGALALASIGAWTGVLYLFLG